MSGAPSPAPEALALLLYRAQRVVEIAANGGDEKGYGREQYEDDWQELAAELEEARRAIHPQSFQILDAAFGQGDQSQGFLPGSVTAVLADPTGMAAEVLRLVQEIADAAEGDEERQIGFFHHMQRQEERHQRLVDAEAELEPGLVVGRLVSWDVDDGAAEYIVAEIRERECVLIRVQVGDDYEADHVDENGICDRRTVERALAK